MLLFILFITVIILNVKWNQGKRFLNEFNICILNKWVNSLYFNWNECKLIILIRTMFFDLSPVVGQHWNTQMKLLYLLSVLIL